MRIHFKWVRYVLMCLCIIAFSEIMLPDDQGYYYCTQNTKNLCKPLDLGDYTISGARWNKLDLKYYFVKGTDDIPGNDEKQAFVNAFNTWVQVVPFTFTEVFTKDEANIKIDFIDSETMNEITKDEGIPGVSYAPDPTIPCNGFILLNDDDYNFSLIENQSGKIDLQYLALHEIGHVLGLCHSSNSIAVMYGDILPRRILSQHDINGIRAIYESLYTANVTVKNEFVKPDNTTFSGGKVYIDNDVNGIDTDLLPDKEARLKFTPNSVHKFEAKEHLNFNGKDWKFNPPSNLNGGWYENNRRSDNPSQVYNAPVSQGTYSARYRYKTKVNLAYATEYDGTIPQSPALEAYQYDPVTITVPGILTMNNCRNKLHSWSDGLYGNPTRTYNPAADTKLTVYYKPIQRSDNPEAFTNQQNKTFRSADGSLHIIYERGGQIWYEFSTDNGITWEYANGGRSIFNGRMNMKNPAVDFINLSNYSIEVIVAAQGEITPNGVSQNCIFVSYLRSADLNGTNFRMDEVCTNELSGYMPGGEPYSTNSYPGIAICNSGCNNLFGFHLIFTTSDSKKVRFVIGEVSNPYYEPPINDIRFYTPTSSELGISADANEIIKNAYIVSAKPFGLLQNSDYYHTFVAVESANPVTNYSKINLGHYSNTRTNIATQGNVISNFSSGSGYDINTKPSIIASTALGGARVIWKGVSSDPGMPESTVIMKDSDPQYNRFWTFENDVNNAHINRTNDRYAIAWTNNDGSVQYTENRTLSAGIVIPGISGQGIQLSNGNTATDMRLFTYRSSQAPYYLKDARVFSNNAKITSGAISAGRGCNLYSGTSQFFFTLGDVKINGYNVNFGFLPEKTSVNSLEKLNQNLITEPFNITDLSKLNYSVQYGIIDTVNAIKLFGSNDKINFKVQLIDDKTGSVIITFDDVQFTADNCSSNERIAYLINTNGVGNRTVRLRLAVSTTLKLNYNILEKYAKNSIVQKANSKVTEINLARGVEDYSLSQNFPNPFNPSTVIDYQLPNDGKVTIKVYDLLGKEIETLVDDYKTKGKYSVTFNGGKLSSGLYFYEIKSGSFYSSRKMLLLK